MQTYVKRLLLFFIGCIGFRSLLVYIAAVASPEILRIMSFFAAAVSIGFFAIYANGWRKTGPEVFGDKIWWNDLRPVHGFLYALFAYHAFQGHRDSYVYLLADVAVGFVVAVNHHFMHIKSVLA